MSCNYNKPKPNPAVLFQANILCFDRLKRVVRGDLICFLCAAFVAGLSIVCPVTPEESDKSETCLFSRINTETVQKVR